MIKKILEYFSLATAVVSILIYFKVSLIDSKLDTKEFLHIREVDSLRDIIKNRDFEDLKDKNGIFTKKDLRETIKPK